MSQEIVAKAKTDLVNSGWSTQGNVGAFGIVNLAAHRLGLGVLSKPSGNNAVVNGNAYSVDVIISRSGAAWDVLSDGGGASIPVFNQIENIDPSRYRDPIQDWPIKFDGPVIEPGDPVDLKPVLAKLDVLAAQVAALRDEVAHLEDEIKLIDTSGILHNLDVHNQFVHEEFNKVHQKLDKGYRNRIIGGIDPK